VRSYLEITTPDTTSSREIARVVAESASLMDVGKPLPWVIRHGETTFEFSLDQRLAEQWQLELRILHGYAHKEQLRHRRNSIRSEERLSRK
jgi:hypothetical protein